MTGMTFLHAILLGALQGLTEFLPISSSGHLVLLQQLFGLHEPTLIFDLFVHIATLFAVCLMYRHDIWSMITAWFGPRMTPSTDSSLSTDGQATGAGQAGIDRAAARRLGVFLIIANIPTAILGIGFESTFEQLFATPWAVGIALIVTGALLWSIKGSAATHGTTEIGLGHALLLGCVQGLAITPGISRSGSTIAAALLCGIPRELAARFSFLMAIPAILGAALLKSSSLSTLSAGQLGLLSVGMLSALTVGYLALRVLVRLVKQGELWRFAFYCWCVGLLAIIWPW